MRQTLFAATLTAAAATSGAAFAQTYTIDKVTISGSKSVPPAQLYAVIKEHPGMKATRDDIVGDQDAITGVLGKANVVGGIKTQLLGPKPNGHYEVTFIVEGPGHPGADSDPCGAKTRCADHRRQQVHCK